MSRIKMSFVAACLAAVLPVLSAGAVFAQQASGDIAQRKREQAQPRTAVASNPAFAKFAGFYQMDLDVFVEFVTEAGQYFFRVTGEPFTEVFPESATKFFAVEFPAQISFARPNGKDIELTLHRDGEEVVAKRVGRTAAHGAEIALQKRIDKNKPDPARAALLRQYIAAEQAGQIPTDIMSPKFLALIRQAWPAIRADNRRMGKLKSLEFRRVTSLGADMYAAEYEQGNMVWLAGSLSTDRKLATVIGVSGSTAESLERIEPLRLQLRRTRQQLNEEGGRLQRRSVRGFASTPAYTPAEVQAEMRESKIEQLSETELTILTELQKEEDILRRGEVTILNEETVPPAPAAKPPAP